MVTNKCTKRDLDQPMRRRSMHLRGQRCFLLGKVGNWNGLGFHAPYFFWVVSNVRFYWFLCFSHRSIAALLQRDEDKTCDERISNLCKSHKATIWPI